MSGGFFWESEPPNRDSPGDPAVLNSVASLYGLWGLDDDARQRWDRSIRLDPRSSCKTR